MATEILLWILGIIVSFILGFFTSWFFDRRQRKDTMANAKILNMLHQYTNAEIRIGDNKNGKIVEKSDGTVAIEWKNELSDATGSVDSVETILTKGDSQKS